MFNTCYYCSAVVSDILKVQKRGKSFVLHVVKGYSAFCQRKCYRQGALTNSLLSVFNFTSHPLLPLPSQEMTARLSKVKAKESERIWLFKSSCQG